MTALSLNQIWNSRYALATLERRDAPNLFLGAGLITLTFVLFHFFGTPNGLGDYNRSVLNWLVARWGDSGISMGSGDYSHGFLVPIASLFVIWSQRDDLLQANKRVTPFALIFILGSLFLHYAGYKTQHPRLSSLAVIGLSWSIPYYLYGWQVAKILLFPCAFLLFAVPLNFLEKFTFPLRMVNTRIAVESLQFLGLDVRQIGTAIYGPPYNATATLKLDVADPCSGIRSLTAMMALTAIYGYLFLHGVWRRWFLFVAAIPLAMAGNVFRIVSIGIMAEAIDTRLATGLPHDYAGFIVFGFAIALMVALSLVLKREFHLPGRPHARF